MGPALWQAVILKAITSVPAEVDLSNGWLQGGAFGLLSIVVLAFIFRVIPQNTAATQAIVKDFREELRLQREEHAAEQEADRRQFKEDRAADREQFREAIEGQSALAKEHHAIMAAAMERNTNATRDLCRALENGRVVSRVGTLSKEG